VVSFKSHAFSHSEKLNLHTAKADGVLDDSFQDALKAINQQLTTDQRQCIYSSDDYSNPTTH